MIAPDTVIPLACNFALVVLGVSLLLTVYRVVRGPTLPDRVLALDMLVGIAIGLIAVIAIRTGYTLYVDIAISLGLVGFLATVAFARFILARGLRGERPAEDGPLLLLEIGGNPQLVRKEAGLLDAESDPSGKGMK
ncbi:cation:proton antiporter [Rhizobium daejeonense]|uniref:Cation:proton antiporter n=1 Tax=Rhizobium daejeonense TaxID=240521 RepID=A0A6M1S4N7_9HYPH|nr:cation:proton antiporter [Rhizobium daejeonense]NGO63408.1 cation:proton antiporter [Rhizobium daejeonense]